MGVYVNEDMPKDCYTCFCYETEFNMCSLTGKRLDNIRIRQDDCPLIETVECKDCKHYQREECRLDPFWEKNTEPTDFCSRGERRADE